ncbi:MAG: hypothetical protein JWO72_3000 [Caulobacteraceae bacterium]|jgi:hypothetical protein|nr:hypothetical protein [Caulobacteraceae bacterium]
MSNAPLRRLIDLPGVRDLEYKALMKPRMADIDARVEFPEIDDCAKALFGLTADEADDVARPAGWDRVELKSERDQVAAFEAEGWDVTDDKRRPLRLLGHFSAPLWLAVRGVAGGLPFIPEPESDTTLSSSLAAEAARFRRNKP